jgi:UDP-GlcNAc:undecaprenyl-phosphate/decaprenyl-phosphate GlcNAc-1-phosphate transferase
MSRLLSPSLLPLAAFLLPLFISWLLTTCLIRLAPRCGLFDDPGSRKVHRQRTPKGGGLAIYAATAITAFFLPPGREGDLFRVLAFGLVIVLLGLFDDLHPLSWQLRLGVQTAVAMAAVLTAPGDPAWFIRAAAVIWIIGLTNAFNMLDNMDALSAGVAWIAAGLLALAPSFQHEQHRDWQVGVPYLVFMGALSGFLWFNRPPARIFMGDAGSTFLGLFLSVSSVDNFDSHLGPQQWAVPLFILAVPWYDLTSVVALRLWQRRSPFHADKQHLSHRLVRLGLRPPMAVAVIYLLTLASGTGALLLGEASTGTTMLAAGQLACWWLAVAAIEYFNHFRAGYQQGAASRREERKDSP